MNAILKYPGSKWSYAEWINSFIPEHKFYVEPYFGSGAIFFNKKPVKFETINDIDSLVVNFFKACRDYPEDLARLIRLTPYSREEFLSVQEVRAGQEIQVTGDCVEDARRFAIRCFQGFGSKLADRVGWKNTKSSTGPVNPRIWSALPKLIVEAAERLKNAQIECTEAITLIEACNAPDCLIYADPPYPAKTRRSRMYRHEMMGLSEHEKLLDALLNHSGPVILSGYDNELYNDRLSHWHKETKKGRANSGAERKEVIWMNYIQQLRLS